MAEVMPGDGLEHGGQRTGLEVDVGIEEEE